MKGSSRSVDFVAQPVGDGRAAGDLHDDETLRNQRGNADVYDATVCRAKRSVLRKARY